MARRFSRRPSAEWRVIFLGFVMVVAFSALVARLWYEQVLCQTQWTKKIAGKSEVTVRILILLPRRCLMTFSITLTDFFELLVTKQRSPRPITRSSSSRSAISLS